VNDLYSENHKAMMKEIKDDIKKWKDIPYHKSEEKMLCHTICCNFYPEK